MSNEQLSIDNDQLPEGYKQTEVGIIPEDWDVRPLAELLTFQNGINADKSAYGHGIPFINVLEVITHTHLYFSDIPGRISLPKPVIESYCVHRGDILFNRTSETQEEVGLASVYLGNEPVVFGGFVIRGQNRGTLIDAIYSGYAFRAPNIRLQIIARGQGAVRANIGQQDLSKVLAVLPPEREQRSIATALSDVDALIASLDKLIAKKRAIKTATMQQLLTGKKRLPGFGEGKGYQKTAIGEIPEDWDVILLNELTSEIGDGIHTTPIYSNNGGYYFVNGNNLFNGKITTNLDTKQTGLSEFKKYKKNLDDRSILMSINGTIGNLAYYKGEPIILGKSSAYLSIKKESSKEYVYFSLQTESVKRFFEDGLTGTTIRNLGLGTIRNTPICIPRCYEEQRSIATVLSDMDAEIAALEARRAKTQSIKQGMMQELLTGRTRLV